MARLKLKKSVKITLLCLIGIVLIVVGTYLYLSSPVDKKSSVVIEVDIEKGMGTRKIAKVLKERELIRSEILFELKAKLNNKPLKASVYQFKKNMSLNQIIDILIDGNKYNPNSIRLTFKEGQTIKDYAKEIENETDNTEEDVIKVVNDKEYVKKLISKYWFLTDEILNDEIYYPLEGYLMPNTYEFVNKKVTIPEIIETMLDQEEKVLDKYKSKIELSTKSVHYYITLASIAELEGLNLEDRKKIIGVFLNRLDNNMNLGSDVTTYYSLQKKMDKDLTVEEFEKSNSYNTRAVTMMGKLPIGPVSNPSEESIRASLFPTKTDYLFFVADKNGKIYYSKTKEEHTTTVAKIKEEGNWIW